MNDMTPFIAPKSAQLTADDLLAGDRTITITEVRITPGSEQPCEINYEGDQNKPWFPCKTMGRVLVKAWGPDAKQYAGKSVQLYRDPDVLWGGMKVGGIRIRALSHINAPFDMALTATRGKKAMARFLPLKVEAKPTENPARKWADTYIAAVNAAPDLEALNAIANAKAKRLADLAGKAPELHVECVHALDNRRAALSTDDWQEGPTDEQRGETHNDDWGSTSDTPIGAMKARIAAADGRETWEAAWADYQAMSASLTEDDADALEDLFTRRKTELAG